MATQSDSSATPHKLRLLYDTSLDCSYSRAARWCNVGINDTSIPTGNGR